MINNKIVEQEKHLKPSADINMPDHIVLRFIQGVMW